MSKMRAINKHFGIRIAILCLFVFMPVWAPKVSFGAKSDKTAVKDKREVVRGVALNWIKIGKRQFERGMHKHSEQSFLFALDYEEYLKPEEIKEINEYLSKTHKVSASKQHIWNVLQAADEFFDNGQLLEAKSQFEQIKESELLTAEERSHVFSRLEKIDKQLEAQRLEVTGLYSNSVRYFEEGQLERAHEGFMGLSSHPNSRLLITAPGRGIEDYLAEIEDVLSKRAPLSSLKEMAEPEPEQVPVIKRKTIEPEKQERRVVTGESKIVVSYMRAVINDAVAKAYKYIESDEFGNAQKAIAEAQLKVDDNKLRLGNDMFVQYMKELESFEQEINRLQQEQQRLAELEQQRRIREQMIARMRVEVSELLTSSSALLEQGQYEQAIEKLKEATDILGELALEEESIE